MTAGAFAPYCPAQPIGQIQKMTDTNMSAKQQEGETWGELAKTVIYAGLIAIVIRTFLFQPFNIPSGSMKETLLVGDYLFVSKFSYGYSHYSLPLSPPLFSGRIWASEPSRGDVVVFRLPKDDTTASLPRGTEKSRAARDRKSVGAGTSVSELV